MIEGQGSGLGSFLHARCSEFKRRNGMVVFSGRGVGYGIVRNEASTMRVNGGEVTMRVFMFSLPINMNVDSIAKHNCANISCEYDALECYG